MPGLMDTALIFDAELVSLCYLVPIPLYLALVRRDAMTDYWHGSYRLVPACGHMRDATEIISRCVSQLGDNTCIQTLNGNTVAEGSWKAPPGVSFSREIG